ncbi:hypothetical protein HK097_003771, partial [Rhizophlyctis rosea]
MDSSPLEERSPRQKARTSLTPETDDEAVYSTVTSFTAISKPQLARVSSSPREHRRNTGSVVSTAPTAESMPRPTSATIPRRRRRVIPWHKRFRKALVKFFKSLWCCAPSGQASDSEERVRVRIRRDSRGRTVIKTRLIGQEGDEEEEEEEAVVEDDEIEWGLSSGTYGRQRGNGVAMLDGPIGKDEEEIVKLKSQHENEELQEMDHVMRIFASALQTLPAELSQRYLFRGLLGYGGNGFVGEAVDRKDGTPVAVKFIGRERVGKEALITSDAYPYPVPLEAEILRIVEHKNITRFHALYSDEKFYMIVMERAAPLTWRLDEELGKESDRLSLNRPGANTPQRRTRIDETDLDLVPPPSDTPTPWTQSLSSVTTSTSRPRSGKPTHPGRMPSDSSLLSIDSRKPSGDPFIFPTGSREQSASAKLGSWTRKGSERSSLPPPSLPNKRLSAHSSQPSRSEPPTSIRHSMFGAEQPSIASLTRPRHCHAGDLYDFLTMYGRTPPAVQRHLFRQLVEAALALKKAGFVYLDFRGENVMVDDSLHVMLVDFGMSQPMLPAPPSVRPVSSASVASLKRQQQVYEVFEQYGTREASAPEILLGRGYRGMEADVWALGLILFLIATGGEEAFKSEGAAIGGAVPFPGYLDP